MASGPAVEMTGTWGERILAIIIVVLMASLGGVITQILMQGMHFHSGKVGPINIKPVLTAISIPPLVGMIIFGCLARNYLCESYMQHYPEPIAGVIRNICLSIILLRGGMELDFKGKGLTVVLLTLVPQNFEALGAALASRWIFNMPWTLCLAQGYTLGAVSPAVLVPSMMILHNGGYGTKKGIPTSLIAAASFDDIIAITIFAVFLTITFNTADGGSDEEVNIFLEVGLNVAQIVGGLVAALLFGWTMKCFNSCKPEKTKTFKFLFTTAIAIATPIVCNLASVPEAKYIFIIFYGYQCYQQWGENKPEKELAIFWMFCQPFLFGTVGAAVQFSVISPSVIGWGVIVIMLGVTFRWLGTILAAFESKYTCKERMFMAFAWIPKATVQAALGAMTLAEAQKRDPSLPDYDQYVEWGQAMLTTAVFAVCITAPGGAIMINTLGTKWLSYDGVEENKPLEKEVQDNAVYPVNGLAVEMEDKNTGRDGSRDANDSRNNSKANANTKVEDL